MLTPSVRGNAGCYRAFTVKAPEGSILNCRKPAAVNLRTRTGWYIAPNVFRALAAGGAGQGPGLHRPARGDQHLRLRPRRAPLCRPSLRRAAGRAARTRGDGKSGLMLADLGREHLDRAVRDPRAGARAREGLRRRTAAAPAGIAAGSASACASASSRTTGRRRSPRSIRRACRSICRACSGASPAAEPSAACGRPTASSSRTAAQATSCR